MKTVLIETKDKVLTGKFTKRGKPRYRTVRGCEELIINDRPIINDWDALQAIYGTKNQILTIVQDIGGDNYTGQHTEAVNSIFNNLTKLIGDYFNNRGNK